MDDSAAEFLDSIKAGFAGRFGSAFEALGIEDASDIALVDEEMLNDLRSELAAVGAKKMHIKRIEQAILAITQPAASVRAKLEEAQITTTSASPSGAQQPSAVARWLARSTKKFACFLSHHKADCAMEARFMKGELERLLGEGVGIFLDSDDLHDLRALLQHVKDSEVLVLLQSKEVLLRPWCLLELHTAITERIPIVAINVVGKGYDFAAMASLCLHIDAKLEALNPGALELLQHHGVDPERLAYELSNAVLNVISVPFNSSASAAVIKAGISDVVDLMVSLAKLAPIEQSFEDFIATRGAAPVPHREHGSFAVAATPAARASSTGKGMAIVPRECPALPRGYQVRTSIMEGLRAKLLRGDGSRTVTVFGMGGSGKTVVGSALLHDAVVGAAFDKLIFLPIGQDAAIRELLALAYRQLTSERLDPKLTEEKALERLREVVAESKVLLLIDDAWEPAQVQALNFLPEAQSASRLVVTTRIHELVPGAAEFELGLLDADTAG